MFPNVIFYSVFWQKTSVFNGNKAIFEAIIKETFIKIAYKHKKSRYNCNGFFYLLNITSSYFLNFTL
jgi:hypothetical protein